MAKGPLVQDGFPTARLRKLAWHWAKIAFLGAAALAAVGGGLYVCALAVSVLAPAIAELAGALQALGTGLVACALGVYLLILVAAYHDRTSHSR